MFHANMVKGDERMDKFLRPRYVSDADYTTNAPSYYDDLARKNKLLEILANRIYDYDQELARRFAEWDKNLEELPEDVKDLLREWIDDGTFAEIINEEIFLTKADKTYVDELIKAIRDDELEPLKEDVRKVKVKVKNYIALSEWCSDTTGNVDVTTDFLAAVEHAKQNRLSILVDGIFKISQPFKIRNEIPEIFGTSRSRSRILFTNLYNEYAITIGSYYTQQNKVTNLSIECIDGTAENGVKIEADDNAIWGYKAVFDTVTIKGFTKNLLKFKNAYNVVFENSILWGYTTGDFPNEELYTTLLISESENSSNLHQFRNTLFLNGRIGLQTFGGGAIETLNCTFENLSLWVNTVSREFGTEPDKSHYLTFIDSWLERIKSGIVNAELNGSSLEPTSPLLHVAPIDKYITLINGKNVWGNVQYPLSQAVNGENYVHFSYKSGYDFTLKRKVWTKATLLSGWTGNVEYKEMENGLVYVRGSVKPTSTNPGKITTLPKLPKYVKPVSLVNVNGPKVMTEIPFMISLNGDINPQFGGVYDTAVTYHFDTIFSLV